MKKILIVDDDPHFLRLAQAGLDQAGYEVVPVLYQDQQRVLALIVQEQPDLVIIDFTLPDIQGTKLGGLIRHSPVESNPDFLILFTRFIENEWMVAIEDWFRVNHNDHIFSKPLRIEEFVIIVGKILKGQNEADRRKQAQTGPS